MSQREKDLRGLVTCLSEDVHTGDVAGTNDKHQQLHLLACLMLNLSDTVGPLYPRVSYPGRGHQL